MGSKDVPISNPIPLTGGTNAEFEEFTANSEGGLNPVKQPVPGGLVGLTGLDWLVELLNVEQLKLYAVTEMVGTPDITPNLIEIGLRVHLVNPVLGNGCYVGTTSDPISLSLTTGTTDPPPPNEPISGVEPTAEFLSGGIIDLKNGTYVDNSFSAPEAGGCTLNLGIPIDIDGLVNSQSGLPSPGGSNETVQNIDTEAVEVATVYSE